MKILKALLQDIESCRNIDKRMGFTVPRDVYEKAMNEEKVYVAKENLLIIGYLRFGYLWDEELPYIQMIRIDPDFRRKGIGSGLVNALEDEMRAKSINLLLSSSEQENEASLNFHKSLGFVECGQLDINKNGKLEIFLKKNI